MCLIDYIWYSMKPLYVYAIEIFIYFQISRSWRIYDVDDDEYPGTSTTFEINKFPNILHLRHKKDFKCVNNFQCRLFVYLFEICVLDVLHPNTSQICNSFVFQSYMSEFNTLCLCEILYEAFQNSFDFIFVLFNKLCEIYDLINSTF